MIALVLEEMAFFIPETSILNVSISISTKTGVNPKSKITSIVDAYVKSGVITSSPGFRSNAIKAI